MTTAFHDPDCRAVLESALALAAQGIRVFPLRHGSKEPFPRSHGCKDATTNPAKIERWFKGDFKKNLGAATGQASGIWVLDVDDHSALEALEANHGALPLTRQSKSGRGVHHLFKTTVLPVPNSAGRIASGIDARGEGGYIAVPPSLHPNGTLYVWLNDAPIVPAPSWLLTLARKPTPPQPPPSLPSASRPSSGRAGSYGLAALKGEIDTLAKTANGSRNHALNRASFCLHQLVAGGELSAAEVERCLIEAATANGLVGDDGLRSVMATIRSGASAGMASPRKRQGARP